MSRTAIQVAVLDMAGTTVADDGLVITAFDAAATAAGLPDSGPEREDARRYVLDTMGQSKITVFRARFAPKTVPNWPKPRSTGVRPTSSTPVAAAPITGAAERSAGCTGRVKVALSTGFSPATHQRRLRTAGRPCDLTLACRWRPTCRPKPRTHLSALIRLGARRVRNVAVLVYTVSDIESGLRAGAAVVAGTLTGAHVDQHCGQPAPTHVFASVSDFVVDAAGR
jgi:phosphoglycolate phosphatase-like HAD superfamily hydrolase